MKLKFYTISVFALAAAVLFPQKPIAQCTCSGGLPANELTYTNTLNPTTAAHSVMAFPQFDPSVGTLKCITLFDTLSITASTGVRNLDTSSAHAPLLRLTLTTGVSGPSISVNGVIDTYYGPDSLMKYGEPGDSITYGPDMVYDSVASQKTNSSNITPYLGNGTVSFAYDISGGTIPIFDGTNYNITVKTQTWGQFRLTYAWCPLSILAKNFRNFYITQKDNQLLLTWTVENESNANHYEIEISEDNTNFTSIGSVQPGNIAGGAEAKYQYKYLFDKNNTGRLYFRIKQTDAAGNVHYSQVRVLNLSGNTGNDLHIFPNPAVNKISLQFEHILKGDYLVELTNVAGQIVRKKKVNGDKSMQLELFLQNPPAAGLYYLRAKELNTNRTFISKLIIRP